MSLSRTNAEHSEGDDDLTPDEDPITDEIIERLGPEVERLVAKATERFAAHAAEGDFAASEKWASLVLNARGTRSTSAPRTVW